MADDDASRALVLRALQAAIGAVAATTGKVPVIGVLAVQFADPEDGTCAFALHPQLDGPKALLHFDRIAVRVSGEMRAAKVRANTIRRPAGSS